MIEEGLARCIERPFIYHQWGALMKGIGKQVIPAVLFLSGLCAVNIALADANTPLEQKSGYDMKTVERGRYLLR